MAITVTETAIILSGACGVEEVETLVSSLEGQPNLSVDLSDATAIHTAVWQALMVLRPKMTKTPVSPLLADKVLDALNAYFRENTQE